MRSRQSRLIAIGAVLALIIGVFYGLDFYGTSQKFTGGIWSFATNPVVRDFRAASLTGVLMSLILWIVIGQEERAIADLTLKSALEAFQADFSKAVLDGIGSSESVLSALGARLDPKPLLISALSIHLHDRVLAERAVDSVIAPFLSADRHARDQTTIIKLSPTHSWDEEADLRDFYLANVRMRYSIKLRTKQFLMVGSESYEHFVDALTDDALQCAWNIPLVHHLYPNPSRKVLALRSLTVDGIQARIQHDYRDRYRIVAEGFEHLSGDDRFHILTYEFTTLLAKKDHILFLAAMYPTAGWSVTFDCTDVDVDHARVYAIDNLLSVNKPVYSYTPSIEAPRVIQVTVDDWVLPRGGVTFVWGI